MFAYVLQTLRVQYNQRLLDARIYSLPRESIIYMIKQYASNIPTKMCTSLMIGTICIIKIHFRQHPSVFRIIWKKNL